MVVILLNMDKLLCWSFDCNIKKNANNLIKRSLTSDFSSNDERQRDFVRKVFAV